MRGNEVPNNDFAITLRYRTWQHRAFVVEPPQELESPASLSTKGPFCINPSRLARLKF